MNKFSERLKDLRAENGLTRAQLAEKLNVSPRLVAYWENGQRECSFDMLIAIADLFASSADYLLGRTEF
ncbi:MAG: helix-turn-helix transcriptional regulator [Clostridia bacterium]|jgi:transcriptional regulator with XRE-family HTH domain|nr:helix-turn-helix transcriptional regulator [Clostridia bacterium]